MKKVIGDFRDMLYTKCIESQHTDVLGMQSGVRWARGYWPWIGSNTSFSQETGAECRLEVKDWHEAHFAI